MILFLRNLFIFKQINIPPIIPNFPSIHNFFLVALICKMLSVLKQPQIESIRFESILVRYNRRQLCWKGRIWKKLIALLLPAWLWQLVRPIKTDASSSSASKRKRQSKTTSGSWKDQKENWRRTKEIRTTAQKILTMPWPMKMPKSSEWSGWRRSRVKKSLTKAISLWSFSLNMRPCGWKLLDPMQKKFTTMASLFHHCY